MGKSSSSDQIAGYEYYLTWAQAICRGPVDALLAVYEGENQLWCGCLRRTPANSITGEAIETFDGESIHFYFGTDDQTVSPIISALHDDPTLLSPFRGTCYAVFDDYNLGNANRAPTISFVVLRQPAPSGAFDVNLAWTAYALMTYNARIPAAEMDADMFGEAADRLEAGTDMGTSMAGSLTLNTYQSTLTYLEAILAHIDGQIIFTAEGKFGLQLLRSDAPVDGLPVVTDDDLTEDAEISSQSWNDITNVIQVQYPRRYEECECDEVPPVLTQELCDTLMVFAIRVTSIEGGTKIWCDVSSLDAYGIPQPMSRYTCVGGKVVFNGETKTITAAGDGYITVNSAFTSAPTAGEQIAVQTLDVTEFYYGIWTLTGGNFPVRIQYAYGGIPDNDGDWETKFETMDSTFVMDCELAHCASKYYRAIDRCGYDCCHAAGDAVAAETSGCTAHDAGCVFQLWADAEPFAVDAGNPTTIGSGSVTLAVTGGYPPFTWTVQGGTLAAQYTTGRSNTLSGVLCGTAYVTCRDYCGNAVELEDVVSTLAGHWEGPTDGCALSGEADTVGFVIDEWRLSKTAGSIKQHQSQYGHCQYMGYAWDCSSENSAEMCGEWYAENYDLCIYSTPNLSVERFCFTFIGSEVQSCCNSRGTAPYYFKWECP